MRIRRRAPASPEPEPTAEERQIRSGIAVLRQASARELMTPRVDVDALGAPVRLGDVAQAVRRSGHSHFPIYEGDLDHLLGVLFVKDLFRLAEEGTGAGGSFAGSADLEVTGRAREPYVVPETRPALEILTEMRSRRRGFAVVVDEHGGFAGVLTMNDLVSELVGDLRDEYDAAMSPQAIRLGQGRFLLDGACSVAEAREAIGLEIPDGEYVTLAGFLLDRFGRIPSVGDVIEQEGWTFRVTRMNRRRIEKVVVEAPSATLSAGSPPGQPGSQS